MPGSLFSTLNLTLLVWLSFSQEKLIDFIAPTLTSFLLRTIRQRLDPESGVRGTHLRVCVTPLSCAIEFALRSKEAITTCEQKSAILFLFSVLTRRKGEKEKGGYFKCLFASICVFYYAVHSGIERKVHKPLLAKKKQRKFLMQPLIFYKFGFTVYFYIFNISVLLLIKVQTNSTDLRNVNVDNL